ncbi:MAG: acyl-CoA dehydrogenase family protein [Pseudomonadales bacterium]|nr:acyl-CoA dehydrogenase family protein [Pseudomonadales bacterium]MDP6472397.1 acyl-CoA dehydrogenase family protein [Pseudomonadales bacterium]MDP6828193.1 acyl-CoA dehydrogenase family protein [Pseudomonadales bacterium]MDP6971692.1 acyl-CoA dehydrogenase family protein [Pseudomonadales bacterium]
MSELDDFRAEARAWLEEHCPDGVRGPGPTTLGYRKLDLGADVKRWLECMAEKGWTVPTWPKKYGGAELDRDQYRVLIEELTHMNARTPLTGRGVNYIGPTILEYGTDDQKARWLPQIARGDGAWAMGYSEPGAGSDLASLQLKAVLDGDHFVLNGRKTWTSDATDCDFIFVLARTSPDKPKHEGISLILVDMDQPGVQVHPIRLLSGKSPFCETVFEDAIARADDVIGGVDNGWTVGKRLLQFERSTHAGINISGSQGGRAEASKVPGIVKRYIGLMGGHVQDPVVRARLSDYSMNHAAQKLTQKRVIEELRSHAPGFASSAVKLSNAILTQEGDELMVEAMGVQGLGVEGDGFEDTETAITRQWLYGKSLTIAGGTKEVQMNIIAKRVLGLPD